MKLIPILAIVFGFHLAVAQTELPTGQIEVVKDYEVRLVESKKIRLTPTPFGIDSTVRRYEYVLSAPSPKIEYIAPELKPLAITPEKKPAYYPFFAKAGFGNPNSWLGQLSYDKYQSETMGWGIDFRHLSANNKKIDLQRFADSEGRINASYLLSENMVIDGYVNGRFEKYYFYGADEIPSNPDVLKRNFNRYDVNVRISNIANENSSFRYSGLFNYLFDKDDIRSKERTLRVGGEVSTAIGAASYPVGLKVIADLTTLKDNSSRSLNNVLLDPYFGFHTGNLKINAGATVLLHKEDNQILPNLEASYSLFDNMVSLRAGWKGDVVKNNFHDLTLYNPYLITRLDSINNQIRRTIYAGIKGSRGNIAYEVTGGYTRFQQRAFFLQDGDDHEQFRPVFDDGSYISLEGALHFIVLKNVNIRGNAYTHFYSLDELDKPWHRPNLGIDAMATYNGGDDTYHTSILFHGENGVPYVTVGGTETRLDPLLDLSIHGDYYFTSAIGVFAQINNILGNKRERWVNYPTYGFNAKAGVMVRL